jgi:hypothetical protein
MPKTQKHNIPEPRVGSRFIFPSHIFIYDSKFVYAPVLGDSGSSIFAVSERFVSCFAVPRLQRDEPRVVEGFDESTSVAKAFTLIKFGIAGRIFEESCEVLPLGKDQDLVIPDWWILENRMI